MAQKLHQIEFAINAALNGRFESSLAKAQTSFSQLGKEIQAVNRIRSDISSFEKQQSAAQKTAARLENLKKQEEQLKIQLEAANNTASRSAAAYAKLESESAKAGKQNEQFTAKLEAAKQAMDHDAAAAAKLEGEQLKLELRIQTTSSTLERQNQRLVDTKNRLQEAGISTNQLSQKDAELSAKLQQLQDRQAQAADGAERFQTTATEAFSAVGQALAAAGITVGLQEIVGAYRDCLTLSSDFGAEISTVEALSGASASEMSALSAEAKSLGASTVFTAQQSADAMHFMAQAGWNAQEMLAGTSGVMDLTSAAGEDLALVADIVTDSLTAFGLTAADTGHFADVLAQTAAKSNTSVGSMGETFKRAAPIAGALGYRIEDVAVMIGLMANAGIKGSMAGTALLNILNGLIEGTTLTSAAFGEYEISAIQADGTMKGFADTINELREQFSQMTEAEKVQNAQAIAGMRGYSGLLNILNATDESYQSLTDDINNCTGAAERMAKIKLDNLKGDVALLNSAWEALRMTVGEQLTPATRKATQGLTALTTKANDLLVEGTALVPMITAATVGLSSFVGVVTTAKGIVPLAATAIDLLSKAMLSIPHLAVAAGIAAAVSAVATFALTVEDTVPSVGDLTATIDDANTSFAAAASTLDDTTNATAATLSIAEQYIAKLETLESATNRTDAENQEYHNTLLLLSDLIPDVAEKIDLQTDSIEGGAVALRAQISAWKQNAVEQAKQNYLNEISKQYNTLLTERAQRSIELTKTETETAALEEKRKTILQRMTEISSDAANGNAELQSEYQGLEQSLREVNDEQRDNERLMGNLTVAIGDYDDALAKMENDMGNTTAEFDKMKDSMSGQGNAIQDVFSQLDDLTASYDDAYQAALASFAGQFSLFDQAEIDAEATVAKVQQALDTQVSYWENYSANVQFLREQTAESLNVTEEEYQELLAAIQSGTPEAVGLLNSIVQNLENGNTQAVSKLAETLTTVGEKRREAVDQTALWTADMSQKMDDIVQNMENAVRQMDMSEESRQNAQSTINAYLAKVQSMEGEVRRAYERLANAAQQGLNSRTLTLPSVGAANTTVTPHAEGGILRKPHIGLIAEAGPEAVIPLSNKRRKQGAALWRQAGQIMGLLSNDISPSIAIENQNATQNITNFVPLTRNRLERISPALTQILTRKIGSLPIDANREAPPTVSYSSLIAPETVQTANSFQEITNYATSFLSRSTVTKFVEQTIPPTVRMTNAEQNQAANIARPQQAELSTVSTSPLLINQTADFPSINIPTETSRTITRLGGSLPQVASKIETAQQAPRLADFPKVFTQARQTNAPSFRNTQETSAMKKGGSVVVSPQIVLQFQGGTTQETVAEIQNFAEGKLRKIVQDELQEACERVFGGLY